MLQHHEKHTIPGQICMMHLLSNTVCRRRFGCGLLVVLLGWTLPSAAAPEVPVIRSWGTEAGLPQNTVNCIVQTRDGYLWLGTREGLARFDGARFTAFGVEEGLRNIEVQALFEDPRGTLWIGSAGGGLSRYFNGYIQSVILPQHLQGGGVVTAIAGDVDGRLWVGTPSGLAVLEQGQFVEPPELKELWNDSIRFLRLDRAGGMWIATSRGLFEFRNGLVRLRPGPPEAEAIVAYCLLEDRRGHLWASIGNGMLLCLEPAGWRVYRESEGVPFAYVTCMAESGDGTIWAGSLDAGLYRLEGERFYPLRKQDGMSADDIRSLLPDREGNLWVGTRSAGLNRLSRRQLVHYGLAQGLTNEFTRSVAQTADGALYVATTGGGLYRGVAAGFEPFPDDPNIRFFASVDSVLAAQDGSLWWGASGALVQWKNDRLAAIYRDEPWTSFASVRALCEDGTGRLWIGTSQGLLLSFRDGQFEPFPVRFQGGAITALALELDDSVWVGTQAGGLKRVRPGSDLTFALDGLPSQAVRALLIDKEGTLWVGTAGGGLSQWRDDRLTSYGPRQGLGADTVSQIVEDDSGYLWLGTTRGIVRVRKSDLDDVAAGKATFLHPRIFGRHEGMPAEECTSGFSPAGLKTREGLICFSTVKGLVLVDPNHQEPSAERPHIMLEEIILNGIRQTLERRVPAEPGDPAVFLQIVPSGREVEIHYTGINFSAPDRVRFRYRMEGLDGEWVEAGGRRVAYYQRIPPGDFVFQVAACNADGVWSEEKALLAVTMLPHFYQTQWFLYGAIILGLGFFGGGLRLLERRRYRRRLARLETQHAIEKERLRISQDMHDHLGGILTQVSQLSDMGASACLEPEPRTRFDRIGTQARIAVQSLDEIIWATDPKNDNLPRFGDYVSRFADEFFEGTSVRCWQEIPTSLPNRPLRADLRHNVFLAIREALHNVLKHSQAREVWIRLIPGESEVVIEIQDNGCGFDPAQRDRGHGLINMKSRLAREGGEMDLTSSPGGGTKVCLQFPLSNDI